MDESVESLKKKLAYYERKLSLGEQDVAVEGYAAYVNIVRQQVEYIKDFRIKEHIEGKKSESAMYDRSESIWKNLPSMISSMNSLKRELKIEYDESDGKPKQGMTSPQSIS